MRKIFLGLVLLASTFFIKAQSLILSATTQTLEAITSSTSQIDYEITYADETTSGMGISTTVSGAITTATTTTILSAPAASTSRHIIYLKLFNAGASSNTITVQKDVSGTNNELSALSISANESFVFSKGQWIVYDANLKQKVNDVAKSITGISKNVSKSMTAADAAGYWYCSSKDGGIPGAWTIGTPGLSGRTTAGTSTTDAGCLYFPTTSNNRYLTQLDLSAAATHAYELHDIVWVNSGLVVTTTTAQTINSVAFPARDDNGTANGKGYRIGLLATAALGNAAVVSNSTVSYTNNAGVSGRTATLSAIVGSQIPATPVIGTVIFFDLQAGDEGVQSIQSITLNTTLTSGSASLFVSRKLAAIGNPASNVVYQNKLNNGDGIRLYNEACMFLFYQANSTTAPQVNAIITSSER